MELIIISQHEDAVHLTALLSRFQLWGMLRFYDLDKVFEGIESLMFRYFKVFVDQTIDWNAFVSFLEELREHQADPMKGLHSMAFLVVDEHSSRLHDFRQLASTVRGAGHP